MTHQIQHVVLEARAERLTRLAETAVALQDSPFDDFGTHGVKARFAQIHAQWLTEDEDRARRDRITISSRDLARLRAAVNRAAPYARLFVDEPDFANGPDDLLIPQELEDLPTQLPTSVSRRDLAKIERSAERLAQLDALGAPTFILTNEVRIMRDALKLACDTNPAPPQFDSSIPEFGGNSLLVWALEPCLVMDHTKQGATNIGLGEKTLELEQWPHTPADILHEQWQHARPLKHPYTTAPLVTRKLLFGANQWFPESLDSAGPISWAVGDDLSRWREELQVFAQAERDSLRARIHVLIRHLSQIEASSGGVVCWFEYLPLEAEGRGSFLVDWSNGT